LGCNFSVEARVGCTGGSLDQAVVEGLAWPGATLTLRAAVLPSRAAGFATSLEQGGPPGCLPLHAGSGLVVGHYADVSAEEAKALVRRWRESAGGPVVVVRCPTEWKRDLDVWGPGRGDLPLMREVHLRFDRRGLFNPGRFV